MRDSGFWGRWIPWRGCSLTSAHRWLLLLSVIWVMAFQNFAQKHSKSDMLFLILYCLMEPFGSACAAVLCTLYLCVWVIFSTGGLVVLSEVIFFIFWGKKYFQFYVIMQNFLYRMSFFFCLPSFGGFIFCFFWLFFAMLHLPKHAGSKVLIMRHVLWASFLQWAKRWVGRGERSVHGIVIKCLLYFSEFWYQHCKAYCLFQTSFWLWYF